MNEVVVYTTAPRAAVRTALMHIPQEVTRGAGSDAVVARVGLAALGRIKQAFVARARGGADESGLRWPPLSPKTIAYGRRGRSKVERARSARPSQALNSRQQERWWALYRQGLAIYKGDKGSAAKRAWGILKREGATTLFDKYKNRQVEILRDTGLLLNSLSPTLGAPGQVFRVAGGSVTIGSNRAGAAAHHRGVPGRLPQRRLWPEVGRWPDAWWRDITDQVIAGAVDAAVRLVRDAR